MTNEWIEWKGGDCPIKSDKTRVEYVLGGGNCGEGFGRKRHWSQREDGASFSDIVRYRIVEDHEPKETKPMTREQILAQIAELEKKLATMPKCIWVNEYENGNAYHTKEEDAVKNAMYTCLRAAVKYQEVIE